MAKKNNKKICFIIAPIGDLGSDIRKRSDDILDYMIKPVTKEFGYETIRADEIPEPGIITSQVILQVKNADLVIADLTGKNPNVFYELAVRHSIGKPVIQIIKSTDSIPFDVLPMRTIRFEWTYLKNTEQFKNELRKQIETIEKNPGKAESPISEAISLEDLNKSKNPLNKNITRIISMLQEIQFGLRTRRDISMLYNVDLHDEIVERKILSYYDEEQVEKALNKLEERDKEILKLRLGLGKEYPHTLEEVGTIFGMRRETIRQIEARAKRKLLEELEMLGEQEVNLKESKNKKKSRKTNKK